MINNSKEFMNELIQSWNSHDLNRIMKQTGSR